MRRWWAKADKGQRKALRLLKMQQSRLETTMWAAVIYCVEAAGTANVQRKPSCEVLCGADLFVV
jgi:predicted LPLAT superfamily acyltransferase